MPLNICVNIRSTSALDAWIDISVVANGGLSASVNDTKRTVERTKGFLPILHMN